VIYSGINFLLSLLYISVKYAEEHNFILIQVLLLAILIIAIFIFSNTSKSVQSSKKDAMKMDMLISRLNVMKVNKEYGKHIESLAEELRFTDTSTYTRVDEEISGAITLLELELSKMERDEEKIISIIESIMMKIEQRKDVVKITKIGGI